MSQHTSKAALPQTTGAAHPQSEHHFVLYRRALHPELFSLRSRRSLNHGVYEVEAWVMQGSHMVRFQRGDGARHAPAGGDRKAGQAGGAVGCACELVTCEDRGLPTVGAVATFSCLGEREYEHRFNDFGVSYRTIAETEHLAANIYQATYRDMVGLAEETDAMICTWEDRQGAPCLSMVELQRYPREVHVQTTHMSGTSGLVLRAQTIFELA